MANNVPVVLAHTGHGPTDRNFQAIKDMFDGASPAIRGQVTKTIALIAGNNVIKTPVKNAQGRHVVFQDAASTILDVAHSGDTWTVNASSPCNVRMIFF